MASLDPQLAAVANVALQTEEDRRRLAEINQALNQLLQEGATHAGSLEGWFTPERAAYVRSLLQRGEAVLWSGASLEPAQRTLYGSNLRHLLELLKTIERQLTIVAQRLEGEQRHVTAARSWLHRQLGVR